MAETIGSRSGDAEDLAVGDSHSAADVRVAAHVENYRAPRRRHPGGDSVGKRTRTRWIQIGDMIDIPSPAAFGVGTEALGAGKGQDLGGGQENG